MTNKINAFLMISAGAGIGALTTVAATSGAGEPATELLDTQPAVRVEAAERMDQGADLSFSGTVRARERTDAAITVPGRVVARPVQIGDRVRRGQVLARIDPSPYAHQVASTGASLAAVGARLEQLQRDVERAEQLHARGAAPEEAVERARAGRDQTVAERDALRARLAEAKRQLAETTLRSPFAGFVTGVHLHVGEYAQPGRAAVSLSGAEELEVEVQLPENLREVLVEGESVAVHRPLVPDAEPVRGTVASVGGAAAGAGRLFPLLVAVEGDALVAGATVEVAVPAPRRERLTVPVSALADLGGETGFVYRVIDERAERVDVAIGELLGRRVAVEGALSPGDEVVVAGHASLVPGERVEVLR